MADEDDLDAFFEEVSEVEAKATEDDAKTEESAAPPPAKRKKTNSVVRPKGVVVASSNQVVLPASEREEKEKAAAVEAQSVEKQHEQQQVRNSAPLHAQPSGIGPAGPRVGPAIGPAFPGATATNNDPTQPTDSKKQENKKKNIVRIAAGKKWVDPSLAEWPENDFRIFVGNLSNEVTDDQLFQHFSKYPSLAKAKIVRDKKNPEKSKGYGFVSLLDPLECARAVREMDQTWLCSRPIRLKRSDWKQRDFKHVMKKQKKESKQQKRMGLKF